MKNTLNKSLSLATKTLILVAVLSFGISTTQAQIITTIAGNGLYGYAGDGGQATNAVLKEPWGVCTDTAGNVYIADTYNNRVRKVTASTGTITTIDSVGGGQWGICRDIQGNIYVAVQGSNIVQKINAVTGNITVIAGNGGGNLGDGGLAINAGLSSPFGVCVDVSGNVYIADGGNERIRKITAATGIITTVAGNGVEGYSGDGGLAINATLGFEFGVCVDDSGNVYIIDQTLNRIRKVTASTGIINTIIGNGTSGSSGDGGLAINAKVNHPWGACFDSHGNLYVADSDNSKIRKVTASTGIINTIAGTGTSGYSGDSGLATSAELFGPTGVYVDISGNVYIADEGNNRIRKITNCPISTYSQLHSDTILSSALVSSIFVAVHIDTVSNNIITTTDSIFVFTHLDTVKVTKDSTVFTTQCTIIDSTVYADTIFGSSIMFDTVIHELSDTVACLITTYNNVRVTATYPSILTNDTLVTVHIDTVLNDVITTTDSMFVSTHTYITMLVKDSTVFMVNQCTNIVDSLIYADTISTSDIVSDTVTHESTDTAVCPVTIHNQVTLDTTNTNTLISISTTVLVHIDTVDNKVIATTDSVFISTYLNTATFVKDSTVFSINQCDSSVATTSYTDTTARSITAYDTTTHTSSDTTILVKTGLESIDLLSAIKVYPNPFTRELTVDVGNELVSIVLMDALSHTIAQTKGVGHTVLQTNVPSGVYFLRVTDKNKSSTTIKVIAE